VCSANAIAMASRETPLQNAVAEGAGETKALLQSNAHAAYAQGSGQAHAALDAQLAEFSQIADQAMGHAGKVVSQIGGAFNTGAAVHSEASRLVGEAENTYRNVSAAQGIAQGRQRAANPSAVLPVVGFQTMAENTATGAESINQVSGVLRQAGNADLDGLATAGLDVLQGLGQFAPGNNVVTDVLGNMTWKGTANSQSLEQLVGGGPLGQFAGNTFQSSFGIGAPDLNAGIQFNDQDLNLSRDFLQNFTGSVSSGNLADSSRNLYAQHRSTVSTTAPSAAGTTRPDTVETTTSTGACSAVEVTSPKSRVTSPKSQVTSPKSKANVDSSSRQQDSEAQDLEKKKQAKYIDEIEDELEAAKVHTMFNMVMEVQNGLNEGGSVCQMLYLTNTQTAKITAETMPNVRAALKIKEPKLVIRLMPSGFGTAYWKTFRYWNERFPEKVRSERSEGDVEAVEHQLAMLVKEVLLPLAITTRALVIGTASCSLAAAFAQVSAPYQRQMGHQCPFHVLLFTRAPSLEMMRRDPTSKACRFSRKSKAWTAASSKFHAALASRWGDDEAFWPHEDILTGCSQAVIFECLSKADKLEDDVPEQFQNVFISSLAEYLPVIALQTFGDDRFYRLPDVADHVNRGLPLMLLDSRRRTPIIRGQSSLKLLKAELRSLSDDLHKQSLMDQHTTSMLAYVKTVYSNLHQKQNLHGDHDAEKHKWLWDAIKSKRDKLDNKSSPANNDVDIQLGHKDAMKKAFKNKKRLRRQPTRATRTDSSTKTIAFESSSDEDDFDDSGDTPEVRTERRLQQFESKIPQNERDLKECTDLVITAMGEEHEWDANFLLDRSQEALDDFAMVKTWEDFEKCWKENWLKVRGSCYHFWRDAQTLPDAHSWIKVVDHGRATSRGRKELQIVKPKPEDFEGTEMPKLSDAVAAVTDNIKRQMDGNRSRNMFTKTVASFMKKEEIWLAAYDILKNESVMTGNLFHINRCRKKLMQLAQKDRLPEDYTLSGLILLRSAWTLADIFAAKAMWYKIVAKFAYFVFLMLSTSMVITTSIAGVYPNLMTDDELQRILLAFALVGSFAAGWTTFLDPAQKWLQLRGGSLALESEIWKFRARVGGYSASSHGSGTFARQESEMHAQNVFQTTLIMIRDKVAQQAGLKETSFYATPTSTDDIYEDIDTKNRDERRPSCLERCARAILVKLGFEIPHGPRLSHAHFKHGQYPDGPLGQEPYKGDDNFHSPITPHAFVRWRLNPQLSFYQHRIPRYARKRHVFQALLMLSSVCCTFLAAMKWSRWAALVAALTSALTAWQEFNSLAKKLSRYSSVSEALGKLLLWWQSLADVDQSNVRNIERLVIGTEELISSEHSAWLSDAQKAAKMFAAMENANKGGSKAESKSNQPEGAKKAL